MAVKARKLARECVTGSDEKTAAEALLVAMDMIDWGTISSAAGIVPIEIGADTPIFLSLGEPFTVAHHVREPPLPAAVVHQVSAAEAVKPGGGKMV